MLWFLSYTLIVTYLKLKLLLLFYHSIQYKYDINKFIKCN